MGGPPTADEYGGGSLSFTYNLFAEFRTAKDLDFVIDFVCVISIFSSFLRLAFALQNI